MGKYLEKFKAEQEAKKKEQEENKGLRTPITMRCFYCGGVRKNSGELGCCKEHSLKAEEIIQKNLNNGLCTCGEPVWVDSSGKKYGVCYDCLARNNKMAKLISLGLKKLRSDFEGEGGIE
jgi:hypothetical protein